MNVRGARQPTLALWSAVVIFVLLVTRIAGLSDGNLNGIGLTAQGQDARVYGTDLYAYGTSYTNGAFSTETNSFVDQTARSLGATKTVNAGAGGSNTPSLPAQYIGGGAGQWDPGASEGLVMLEAEIGEALSERAATADQSRLVFENGVKTALRWFRASDVVAYDDAAISPNGAWTFEDMTGGVVPSRGVTTTSEHESLTITPGGPEEIVILTAPWRLDDTDEQRNSDFKVRVDGGAWQRGSTIGHGDTRTTTGGSVTYTVGSYRVTGLSPTSTVEVQKSGEDGELWLFDKYLVMGQTPPPPVILVQDVPLVASDPVIEARTNLVTNPGFESSASNWVGTSGGVVQQSNTLAHTGSSSANFVYTERTRRQQPQSTFDAVQGRAYTLSAWVWIPWETPGVRLNASGSVTELHSSSTVRNAQWERVSITAVADATGPVTLTLDAVSDPVAGQSYYFDDVLVEEGPLTLPYFDGSSDGASWTGPVNESSSSISSVDDSGPWNLGPNYGELASNRTVEVYRAIIRRIAASPEFADGSVVIADPSPWWDPNTSLDADGIHPNDVGHTAYATAIKQAAQLLLTQ